MKPSAPIPVGRHNEGSRPTRKALAVGQFMKRRQQLRSYGTPNRKALDRRTPCHDGLIFEQVFIGNKRRNLSYIVGDRHAGVVAVIDAGFKPEMILDRVTAWCAEVRYVLATHGHRDHKGAALALKRRTGAQLAAYKTHADADVLLDDGDILKVGKVRIRVIHTPGHSADSVCFLIDERKLITGDTLYVGGVPKPPRAALRQPFFTSLHERLMTLDDAVEIWPGHDNGARPSSTIGNERRDNPVVQMSFDHFCHRRWDKRMKKWIAPTPLRLPSPQ